MASLEPLANALRCALTHHIMVDPVVVVFTKDANLEIGRSYERFALQDWLEGNNDNETQFRPNPALATLIVQYWVLQQQLLKVE